VINKMDKKRRKKKKDSYNFKTDDSLKLANSAMGLAFGTQVLKEIHI